MPLYVYRCAKCDIEEEVYLKLAELDKAITCEICYNPVTRVIKPVPVIGDYESYQCPVTGKEVSGRKAHKENLKRTGCRVLEDGEKDQLMKQKLLEEQQFDKAVGDTVEQVVANMPAQKIEQLAKEVQHGADVEFVRK